MSVKVEGKVTCPYCKSSSKVEVLIDFAKRGTTISCPKCSFMMKNYPYRKIRGVKDTKSDENAEFVEKNQKTI